MTKKRFNQKVFLVIEMLISLVELFIRKFNPKPIPNSLLIVKMDAMGDYILLRNFLHQLKKQKEFASKRWFLIGNKVWKNIAEELDGALFETCYWLDYNKYFFNLAYRFEKRLELTGHAYDIILHPTHSRVYSFDSLIHAVKAKEKIAPLGDYRNTGWLAHQISNRFYTRLIPADKNPPFEFHKNAAFFEALTGTKKPELEMNVQTTSPLKEKYVVLFPDAAVEYRKWSPSKYGRVAAWLFQEKGYKTVIVGLDQSAGKIIQGHIENGEGVLNLAGKTTLVELIPILREAEFLVSNDSGLVHIAAAVNTPVFCISNGNHYGRFIPYPEDMHRPVYAIVPQEINTIYPDFNAKANAFAFGSDIDINAITEDQVINEIERHT